MNDTAIHVTLPNSVDQLLRKICTEQNQTPPSADVRLELASLGEDAALQILSKISAQTIRKSLSGFIIYMIRHSAYASPSKSPCLTPHGSPASSRHMNFQDDAFTHSPTPTHMRGFPSLSSERPCRQTISPQLVALGELEFRKAFLILSYIGGKTLNDVDISANEIRRLKDFPMVKFEFEVWNLLGKKYVDEEDRRMSLDWDSGKTHLYHCHVAPDGSCRFKGPYLQKTRTHLQRVLGDDNVLIVKFAEEVADSSSSLANPSDSKTVYSKVAREGILVGLRRYQFFVFKDGGKEEKKKNPTTSPVKCFFVCMESNASLDENKPYVLFGKTVREARCAFMHVHTLSSLASYMARFSLILSKTTKLKTDLASVHIERIEDIPCRDKDGDVVHDKNGKALIHTDGTGFISEDLALEVAPDLYRGESISNKFFESIPKDDEFKGKIMEILRPASCRKEPPLLIQFRLYNNGSAVKGTLLIDKRLPPRTIQIRDSMIKVETDCKLSTIKTENSLEIVRISNQPRRAYLSRNLIALLSYGGVPNEFFMDILMNALGDTHVVFSNKRAAIKVSLMRGTMDDYIAARMILSGIPLDESFLQYHLSILMNEERTSLKGGKIPVPECYYLMGTVDPTGILERDQVCIILENTQVSGEVLVYRNPGVHFGDIHVLKATYVKALESVVGNAKFAIFFPCKGPRSLADEIAGGDYDGDMYWVSKNPQLLKYFKESKRWTPTSLMHNAYNKKPSEFSAEELEEELFKLFLATRFQPSNAKSVAADSWLALMDRLLTLGDNYADEKDCLRANIHQLIDIYYDALDAPKKGGKKIQVPKELKAEVFPHYMERRYSFTSTSILGLIFDTVDSYQTEDLSVKEVSKLSCFDVEVPEACLNKWREHYDQYRCEMKAALDHNGGGKNESAAEVIKKYKQILYGAEEFEVSPRKVDEIFDEALAIYCIVYDYAKVNSVSRCGFAWKVAGSALCKLYTMKQDEKTFVCPLSVMKEIFC